MKNKIDIIPQIQKVIVQGEFCYDCTESHVMRLLLPEPDGRLEKRAASLPFSIHTHIGESDLFMLSPYFPRDKGADAAISGNSGYPLRGRCDSYYLDIDADGLFLCADTARGFFYGLGTLLKLLKSGEGSLPFVRMEDWADIPIRCDYMEFRNFYPIFEHVLEFLPEMAGRHINYLIVEMEDKRPFPGFSFLRDQEEGFSSSQIYRLQEIARENFIELIPLQQTFGHLEYVLGKSQYRGLRELPDSPGELCPMNSGSVELAAALIQDIDKLFPGCSYLHIGCDEVWSLGECSVCQASGLTKTQIFIRYVNQLVEEVCCLGKIPLFWYDMLEHCTLKDLEQLDKRAVVVLWMYDGNDMIYRASRLLDLFKAKGIQVWGGCAVRCWDQSGMQNYPVLEKRRKNIMYWQEISRVYGLKGIVNTNWSAYSALACPYGIYETSVYPGTFAAEQAWNGKADSTTFLERYLKYYHGMPTEQIVSEGWQFEDYYGVVTRFAAEMKYGREFSLLMEIISQYERAVQSHFPAYLQLFRVQLYPENEAEWESFYERFTYTFGLLAEIRPRLEKTLCGFLSETAAKAYVASRYCCWEIMEKEIICYAKGKGREGFLSYLSVD